MPSPRLIFGSAAAVLSIAAAAQAVQQQPGFFAPKADPDLAAPDRSAQAAQPAQPAQAVQPMQPASSQGTGQAPAAQAGAASQETPNSAIANDPTRLMRWTEQQMDRSEQEAAHARVQASTTPAPINGAFTGNTNERDR
jgi:hypothetical protein